MYSATYKRRRCADYYRPNITHLLFREDLKRFNNLWCSSPYLRLLLYIESWFPSSILFAFDPYGLDTGAVYPGIRLCDAQWQPAENIQGFGLSCPSICILLVLLPFLLTTGDISKSCLTVGSGNTQSRLLNICVYRQSVVIYGHFLNQIVASNTNASLSSQVLNNNIRQHFSIGVYVFVKWVNGAENQLITCQCSVNTCYGDGNIVKQLIWPWSRLPYPRVCLRHHSEFISIPGVDG